MRKVGLGMRLEVLTGSVHVLDAGHEGRRLTPRAFAHQPAKLNLSTRSCLSWHCAQTTVLLPVSMLPPSPACPPPLEAL